MGEWKAVRSEITSGLQHLMTVDEVETSRSQVSQMRSHHSIDSCLSSIMHLITQLPGTQKMGHLISDHPFYHLCNATTLCDPQQWATPHLTACIKLPGLHQKRRASLQLEHHYGAPDYRTPSEHTKRMNTVRVEILTRH